MTFLIKFDSDIFKLYVDLLEIIKDLYKTNAMYQNIDDAIFTNVTNSYVNGFKDNGDVRTKKDDDIDKISDDLAFSKCSNNSLLFIVTNNDSNDKCAKQIKLIYDQKDFINNNIK